MMMENVAESNGNGSKVMQMAIPKNLTKTQKRMKGYYIFVYQLSHVLTVLLHVA